MLTRVSELGNSVPHVCPCSHYQGSCQNLGPWAPHRRASGAVEIRSRAIHTRTAALTQVGEYHLGSDVLSETDFGKEHFRKDVAVSLEGI